MDLKGRRFAVFGLQGTGKTNYAKWVLQHYPRHLVYDPLKDYQGFNRYLPANRSYTLAAIEEINTVVDRLVFKNVGKLDLFVIDEANRYCPNKRILPAKIGELNDFNRHMNLGFGIVARRPVQLNTDLVELAHDLFIFRLKGKNDIAYLDSLVDGLGNAVLSLPRYHFVHVDEFRDFEICNPVELIK
jgi:DNA helicase HerA-like ATPase